MGTVTANGVRFSYLEQGSGPLVLFVHGFPDTPYTWDASMAAVAAAGYRCIAPFTRGYAPSEIPADGAYDSETLANDVLALIDAFGGKAVVVGHDWGASAAYGAATLGPEKVRLLVTLAIPHPRSIRPTPLLAWKVRHFVTLRRRHAVENVRKRDFAMVDELVHRWSPAWDVPPGETARVKAAFAEPGCLDAALGYYRAMSTKLPASLRQKITVPTVSFAGETDMVAPRLYEKARTCFTSSYEVVQMPGGHFMHREHPAHFTRELVRVLRDKAPV
jgi:pimeloyl-ACP methyl ester carboxylesterase